MENNKNDMIHVCFGVHDKDGSYILNVCVVIYSIIQHTNQQVYFHILVDQEVSNENLNIFNNLIKSTNHSLSFDYVDANLFNINCDYLQLYSIGSLFRLIIPEYYSNLEKIIYLDTDILFLKDIGELWNTDISLYSLAAVNDRGAIAYNVGEDLIKTGKVSKENYFNSGMLVMNLSRLRQKDSLITLVSTYLKEHTSTKWPDQDALNYLFSDSTLLLDESWNSLSIFYRNKDYVDNAVFHFAGDHFINYQRMDYLDIQLIKARIGSGFDSQSTNSNDIINTLGKIIRTSFNHTQIHQYVITKLARKNVKVIYYGTLSHSMKNLINIIGTKYGDYFIFDNNTHADEYVEGLPVFPFSELSKEIKGSFIVFVLPDADTNEALSKLNQIGLTRDEDYFVIPCMLLPSQGGYIY